VIEPNVIESTVIGLTVIESENTHKIIVAQAFLYENKGGNKGCKIQTGTSVYACSRQNFFMNLLYESKSIILQKQHCCRRASRYDHCSSRTRGKLHEKVWFRRSLGIQQALKERLCSGCDALHCEIWSGGVWDLAL
jgi:hypothetical protein